MNINPTSHFHIESHTITNCMHVHHSVPKGGMSFQTEMQQNVKAHPQTVEEALQELTAINRESYFGHKILGTGNTLGNVISEVTGEGPETVVIPMADNSANANRNNNSNLQITVDMLNAIVMPRKDSLQRTKTMQSSTTSDIISLSDTASGSQLREKKKGFISINTNRLKKRIRKWIQVFPEKFRKNIKEHVNKNNDMKVISQEYILDTYDKNGQYQQLEKRGMINDNLNKKA